LTGHGPLAVVYNRWMKKIFYIVLTLFAVSVVAFGTWQLFLGNLEAAFSTFPFLLIIYLFIRPLRNS
jgi:hypothetical protein